MRNNISSGSPWEPIAGYSRAVQIGEHISVSGTTASNEAGEVQSPGDPFGQTVFVLQKIESALAECNATRADVIRTRIFVTDIEQWEAVARAHQQFFGDIRPACTLVEVSRLVNDELLVEIEADAIASSDT